MNPFEMVVLIVLIVSIAGVLKSRLGRPRARAGDDAATASLRQEVGQLRQRLAVLERIAIEKETSLEREFEKLRDERPA